jgi:cell division protein ZapA (FtsZ GTPase activity inhibitor)
VDQLISIELFGQSYKLKASGEVSEPEELAEYVTEQVEKARGASGDASKFDALILTVLSIANDYFEMRRSRQSLLSDIEDRCRVLIDHVDAHI